MTNKILIVIGVLLLVAMIVWMVVASTNVGPGCPGDPTWLGYCADLDVQ